MSAESQGREARAARLTGFDAAGLVPSKTKSAGLSVNLSAPESALRRIKRLKRSVWASGHLHGMASRGMRPPQCWFVTLTYVGVSDWKPQHIRDALRRFRSWCEVNGHPCRYTWVAELQNRGAVHYHLLAWLPQGVRMPHWDRPQGRRAAFWPHGMTNTEKALSGVGYLMKYLSKLGELTKFPKGLRLYGIGGLCKDGRSVRRWYNLPEWAKRSFGVGELVRRKVGLIVHATGELLAPAYKVLRAPGCLVIQQVREVPDKWAHGAYSAFPRATV